MQDFSRDDFSILNGSDTASCIADKEMCPTLIYRIQDQTQVNSVASNLSKPQKNVDDAAQDCTTVKTEDTSAIDLFSSHSSTWQQHPTNTDHDLADHRLIAHSHSRLNNDNTKLLLQGSDDPLISHGANSVLSYDDEHPADFAKSLMIQPKSHCLHNGRKQDNKDSNIRSHTQEEHLSQRPVKSGCSNLTKQQLKVKANLMSARNQQQQLNQNNTLSQTSAKSTLASIQKHNRTPKTKKTKGSTVKLRFHHQALPPEYLSHYEATQGQQQVIKNQKKTATFNQKNTNKASINPQKHSQSRNSHENVRSWLQKIAEIQRTANASKENGIQSQKQQYKSISKESENMSKSHLPKNGLHIDANNNTEMQNRHKVQDIHSLPSSTTPNNFIKEDNCHSILKRLYYSDLPYMGEITLDNFKPRRGRKPKKADICHLIYKNYGTITPKKNLNENCCNYIGNGFNMETHNCKNCGYEQPLNLCLRDQFIDSYSISSGDEISETNSSCPTPVTTPVDFVRDSMLASNLKISLKNINEQISDEKTVKPLNKSSVSSEQNITHPITMYYQKLLDSGLPLHTFKTIQKDNQLSLKIPMPPGLIFQQKMEKGVSHQSSKNFEYPDLVSTDPDIMRSLNSFDSTTCSVTNQQQLTKQKRKRSAIFIPPTNAKNSTNPATEVSICKFKFTGGLKPTLKEKKMLSVDAGGNYCYFSGTGDKASRGYEYFPRETLQHMAGLLPGVNCSGQKLSIDILPPSAGLSNELLQISDSPTSSMLLSGNSTNSNTTSDTIFPKSPTTASYEVSKNEACSNSYMENSSYSSSSPTTLLANRCAVQRKKNIPLQQQLRKSSQREKIEKTFKEQGFLIKTQQLESAEGVTYCKFRQLKKFTRYLFRNWKGYLPDNLQQKISKNSDR